MNDCTFVLLGASGDLAKRKLLPALYQLIEKEKIDNFIIVGAAIDQIEPAQLLERATPFMGKIDEKVFTRMLKNTFYHQLDFFKKDDFTALTQFVTDLEKQHKLSGNRIIYLATFSQYYCTITEHIAASGLAKRCTKNDTPWQRIVYEKPFGYDLASAHEINECIARNFDESQIYRIDHYLTKELVGNITLVRFTNLVFEPLWNNRYIDNVQIILSEDIGIDGRGQYYDKYGAIKDVVQNHMLELVALIGMESPEKLTGEYIRQERARVLEKVRAVDVLLGQYEGYQSEPHVAPHSTTETFAMAYLAIDNPRWAGVPFYLKTGKCLDRKETVIHIKFKQVDCLLARNCPSESNYLTIRVTPDASFALSLNAKKPGTNQEVIPVKMEFCHSCLFGNVIAEAHEIIFEEIMRGEQSISVRFDEIESAWKIIEALKTIESPIYEYKKGSRGPREAEQFSAKHGVRWLS